MKFSAIKFTAGVKYLSCYRHYWFTIRHNAIDPSEYVINIIIEKLKI